MRSEQKINTLGHRITMSSDMQTPYAGAAGVFLLVNGKSTIGKLKSSRLS